MSSDPSPRPAERRGRRRARWSPLVAVALSVALLAGCETQRTPGNYNSSVRNNFIEACQGKNLDQQNRVSAPRETCTCAYDGIRKEISFKRFKEVNDLLSEKPRQLPADVRTIIDGCNKGA